MANPSKSSKRWGSRFSFVRTNQFLHPGRWITSFLDQLKQKGGDRNFIDRIKLSYCYPRIDIKVTEGFNHLLKVTLLEFRIANLVISTNKFKFRHHSRFIPKLERYVYLSLPKMWVRLISKKYRPLSVSVWTQMNSSHMWTFWTIWRKNVWKKLKKNWLKIKRIRLRNRSSRILILL